MRDEISAQLATIENTARVKILYACESGSRAWGFPSANSDYDVRFIYLRPVEWYLSIDDPRDVIELPANDALDIVGWDLKKALRLLRKSNPPLLEWLSSPIVYQDCFDVAEQLRQLTATFYSPVACLHHYLHMAQGNYREYLKGDEVWVKKYFYVLRPLLAINWIEQGRGVVPMAFGTLVDEVVTDAQLKKAIEDLIDAKRAGAELDRGPRIPILSEFIESEMARLEHKRIEPKLDPQHTDLLDAFFRATLTRVWQTAIANRKSKIENS